MMLYPSMADLLKKVPSRYLLVNVIARRAREIAIEDEESGNPQDDRPVSRAIEEIADGKLSVNINEQQ